MLTEYWQCLTWYRRTLRPKDVDKLVNTIPDLYKSVQQERSRSGLSMPFAMTAMVTAGPRKSSSLPCRCRTS